MCVDGFQVNARRNYHDPSWCVLCSVFNVCHIFSFSCPICFLFQFRARCQNTFFSFFFFYLFASVFVDILVSLRYTYIIFVFCVHTQIKSLSETVARTIHIYKYVASRFCCILRVIWQCAMMSFQSADYQGCYFFFFFQEILLSSLQMMRLFSPSLCRLFSSTERINLYLSFSSFSFIFSLFFVFQLAFHHLSPFEFYFNK